MIVPLSEKRPKREQFKKYKNEKKANNYTKETKTLILRI